jgi:CheY-like chemotaxis protein
MTQPLALVFYTKLMPGSQLANRLQDLKYRVEVVNDLATLPERARQAGPMLVLADLESGRDAVCQAIAALKADATTQHIPVIAFAGESAKKLRVDAQLAGAALAVGDAALLGHLQDFLDQALQVE